MTTYKNIIRAANAQWPGAIATALATTRVVPQPVSDREQSRRFMLCRAFGLGHGIGQMLIQTDLRNTQKPGKILGYFLPGDTRISTATTQPYQHYYVEFAKDTSSPGNYYSVVELASDNVTGSRFRQCDLSGLPQMAWNYLRPTSLNLETTPAQRKAIEVFTGVTVSPQSH